MRWLSWGVLPDLGWALPVAALGLSVLAGCTTEDRLHGTWTVERMAISRTNGDDVALTYPATQVDECIALWGYEPEDCRAWYDDTIEKSIFYDFDSISGQVAIVQRSCADDICGDQASTVPFSVYTVDGVKHVAIGSNYGGRGMALGFEAGNLRLRDVQVSCNNYYYYYYYYYYYGQNGNCQTTVTEWTFSRS